MINYHKLDKVYAVINTVNTIIDGYLKIEVIGSDDTEFYIGTVEYSESFSNGAEKSTVMAKTAIQFERKVNKILYNMSPEDEIFWIGWSAKRGFEKRYKIDNFYYTKEEIKQYINDNKENFLIDEHIHIDYFE